MSQAETARTNYDAARAELLTRVRLRDQVLLIYLGFVGAVFGLSLGASGTDNAILLTLPFLSLGCSILVSQHNAVIGALIKFNTEHISIFLTSINEGAPEFTNSPAFKNHSLRSNVLRSWGHMIILLVPCVISLSYNIRHAIGSPFPTGPAWWFALVCTIGTVWIIQYVHELRRDVYNTTTWHK